MIRYFSLVLFLLFFVAAPETVPAQEKSFVEEALDFSIDSFQLRTLPGGIFYTHFFENLAPDTTFLIEESNGFSLIDRPRVYFEGNPFSQFRWSVNGRPTDSVLEPGGPLFLPPFSVLTGFRLRSESPGKRDFGFNFAIVPSGQEHFRAMFSTVVSGLGSYSGLGKYAISPHPETRSPDLYDTRRKVRDNTFADFSFQTSGRKHSWLVSGSYFSIVRQFNDFNRKDSIFTENGSMASIYSRYTRNWLGGKLEADAAVFRNSRDRLFAELGRYPQETYDQGRTSLYTSLSYHRPGLAAGLYLQSEGEERTPRSDNFAKDIFDIDGEGMNPFEPWGTFSALKWGGNLSRDWTISIAGRKAHLGVFFSGDQRWLSGNEEAFDFNPILAKGQPYQVILWNAAPPFRNQGSRLWGGFTLRVPLGSGISLLGRAQARYQSLSFAESANNLAFWSPDFDVGLVLFEKRNPEVLVAYGRSGDDLGTDVALFLEHNRPSGAIHEWEDRNDDGRYQVGEEGRLFGTTGALFHSMDPDMRLPQKERLLLALSTKLSRHFRLDVKGMIKKIHQPLWVRFANEMGHSEKVGGEDVFFFDRPFREYLLTNSPMDKDPFYAQLSFRIHGARERKWYFSFSFMTHIGMGVTAFGNGPGANDLGIIDESQANPNAMLHGYGRLDGDRAFVGRIFLGYYLLPRLFFSGSVKYRDGDPFAFLDAVYRNDQWAIYYRDIKAEDERGKKGGPREDCVWEFHAKLSYEFRLFGRDSAVEAAIFNFIDFGSELSENVFSGGLRQANELQLARTLRLGLTIGL